MGTHPIPSRDDGAAAPEAPALTLFHHPFCPHSRFVRTVLGEYGMPARLGEERVWDRREACLMLNPAGTTPVLVEEGHPPAPGSQIIAEYLDEPRGAARPEPGPLPPDTP